jgi:GNAT superfamily N-acetyltransferase
MTVDQSNRYLPTVGDVEWDIKALEVEQKNALKGRLSVGITHSEEEFQAVMSYLHMKYPDLMDYSKDDGKRFQWRYTPYEGKEAAVDSVSGKSFNMYALVYYDPERGMEPVAAGGSYLRKTGQLRYPKSHKVIPGQNIDKNHRVHIGHGYILFIDPNYRRLGLAESQWLTEAQLYRDSGIKYQEEVQTVEALKVTQAMFDDPAKCIILKGNPQFARGRDSIRCAMDYTDESLVKNFQSLPENLRNFRNPLDWSFLEREGLSLEGLIEPWKKK